MHIWMEAIVSYEEMIIITIVTQGCEMQAAFLHFNLLDT